MIIDMSYMEMQVYSFLVIMSLNTISIIIGWQYYKRKRRNNKILE